MERVDAKEKLRELELKTARKRTAMHKARYVKYASPENESFKTLAPYVYMQSTSDRDDGRA